MGRRAPRAGATVPASARRSPCRRRRARAGADRRRARPSPSGPAASRVARPSPPEHPWAEVSGGPTPRPGGRRSPPRRPCPAPRPTRGREWYSWPPVKMLGVGRPIELRQRAVGAAADRRAQRLEPLGADRALGHLDDLGEGLEVGAHVGVLVAHVDLQPRPRLAGDDLLGRARAGARRARSSRSSSKSRTMRRMTALPAVPRHLVDVDEAVAPGRSPRASASAGSAASTRPARRAALTSLPVAKPGWTSTPWIVTIASAPVNVSSCSSPTRRAVHRVGARARRSARRRRATAPWPISSSGVKPMRSVGRGSSGCAARWATAAMISATPALSSAPSSVSPLEVTMSWPSLPASSGIAAGSRTVSSRGSSIGAAVVGAVDDRLDPGAGRVGARVDVGDEPDDRRVAVDGAGQRGHHVAVVVELGVLEADGPELLDEHPREVELARRAGRSVAVAAGLGVDADVALEAIEEIRRRAPRPAGR